MVIKGFTDLVFKKFKIKQKTFFRPSFRQRTRQADCEFVPECLLERVSGCRQKFPLHIFRASNHAALHNPHLHLAGDQSRLYRKNYHAELVQNHLFMNWYILKSIRALSLS
jgi:hypothetical protein